MLGEELDAGRLADEPGIVIGQRPRTDVKVVGVADVTTVVVVVTTVTSEDGQANLNGQSLGGVGITFGVTITACVEKAEREVLCASILTENCAYFRKIRAILYVHCVCVCTFWQVNNRKRTKKGLI